MAKVNFSLVWIFHSVNKLTPLLTVRAGVKLFLDRDVAKNNLHLLATVAKTFEPLPLTQQTHLHIKHVMNAYK